MARKGLITVNKFIELLLQEVRNFDFENYQRLILRKARLTQHIREKHETYEELEELYKDILPQQIKIVSYYFERLPKLQRIIEILSKNQKMPKIGIVKKFSSIVRRKKLATNNQSDEYEYILELLRILVRIGRKNLLSVLEDQEKALKNGKRKKYLKLISKEHNIGYQFVAPLLKLGVKIDSNTFQSRKKSINWKRLILAEAAVILIFTSIIGTALHPKSPISFYHGFVSLDACAQQIGAKLGKDATATDWLKIVEKFYKEDLNHETAIETQFEEISQVSVRGEYIEQDIELTKTFFERTYGFENTGFFTPTITYLPPGTELKYLDANERKCAAQSFAGLAWEFGIVLISSENEKPMNYFAIIAHEYAHKIHHFYSRHDSKFNNEWDKIQGGYARRYGTNNRNEDVATTIEAAVVAFLKGKNVMAIKPIDGNQEAFHAKLRLLKKHRFLPPTLKLR